MEQEIGANGHKHLPVVYLHPESYSLFFLVLIVFSLIVVVGLLIVPMTPSVNAILLRVDFLICVIFIGDFLLSFWRAQNKADYFFKRGGWLDLLGVIPVVPSLKMDGLVPPGPPE
jgi:voltage-gated potassium channel